MRTVAQFMYANDHWRYGNAGIAENIFINHIQKFTKNCADISNDRVTNYLQNQSDNPRDSDLWNITAAVVDNDRSMLEWYVYVCNFFPTISKFDLSTNNALLVL